MIYLTRLDGKQFVANCDHILTVEHTPDTVVTATTGMRWMVRETVEEVIDRVIHFRQRTGQLPEVRTEPRPEEGAIVGEG